VSYASRLVARRVAGHAKLPPFACPWLVNVLENAKRIASPSLLASRAVCCAIIGSLSGDRFGWGPCVGAAGTQPGPKMGAPRMGRDAWQPHGLTLYFARRRCLPSPSS
jgi:hypothetical protein